MNEFQINVVVYFRNKRSSMIGVQISVHKTAKNGQTFTPLNHRYFLA